jgi:hypothetical protein
MTSIQTVARTLRDVGRRSIYKPKEKYFFLHFSKCSGTFVVESLKRKGYKTARYLEDGTGCEYEFTGNLVCENATLRLVDQRRFRWSVGSTSHSSMLTPHEHVEFLDATFEVPLPYVSQVIESGVNLICFEFAMPSAGTLRNNFPDWQTFTVLRDPVARIVSDYKFQTLLGQSPSENCRSLADYVEKNIGHAVDNLYTRQLNHAGRADQSSGIELTEKSVNHAFVRITSDVDRYFLMEEPNYLNSLDQFLRLPKNHKPVLSFDGVQKSLIQRGVCSPEELQHRLNAIRITENCLNYAREKNQYDIQLYQRLWLGL